MDAVPIVTYAWWIYVTPIWENVKLFRKFVISHAHAGEMDVENGHMMKWSHNVRKFIETFENYQFYIELNYKAIRGSRTVFDLKQMKGWHFAVTCHIRLKVIRCMQPVSRCMVIYSMYVDNGLPAICLILQQYIIIHPVSSPSPCIAQYRVIFLDASCLHASLKLLQQQLLCGETRHYVQWYRCI